MNKTLATLFVLALGASSTLAMAKPDDTNKPAKNPAMEQSLKACHAELGKPMPTKPDSNKAPKAGEKQDKKDAHPKMSEQDRKAMDDCMSKKGFQKPPKPEHSQGKPPAPKAS